LIAAGITPELGGDLAWVEEHTSRADGTVAIGTDRRIRPRLRRDHGAERRPTPDTGPQIRIVIDDVRGYEEGDVGWSDATGRFEHDGASVPVRITDVLRREERVWRSVQTQASVGVSDANMFETPCPSEPPQRRKRTRSSRDVRAARKS